MDLKILIMVLPLKVCSLFIILIIYIATKLITLLIVINIIFINFII